MIVSYCWPQDFISFFWGVIGVHLYWPVGGRAACIALGWVLVLTSWHTGEGGKFNNQQSNG